MTNILETILVQENAIVILPSHSMVPCQHELQLTEILALYEACGKDVKHPYEKMLKCIC